MRRLRWQILIVILALAAIGLLLLIQRREPPPAVSNDPGEAVGPQPATGGIYTEGLIGSPGRLNPVLDFHNPVDRDVNRLLYSSLVQFDGRGLPVADLAESWGISQDGTVYNFSLKPGAVWHDGEPVTSADVAFTIDLLRSDGLPVPKDLQEFWNAVEVDPLDTQLVQFVLPEPFAPFLDYLTFGILPEHLLSGMPLDALVDSDFHLAPIGSGPYRFEQWLSEDGRISGVVLTAFEDYYDGRPFIDQFVFRYYDRAEDALAAYRSGEIMGLSEVPRSILKEALAEPGLNLYSSRLPELSLVLLNLENTEVPFFQDVVVRQALYMAINRQRLVDTLLAGQAIVADSPLFPGTWAYFDGAEQVPYDPDQAVDLLRSVEFTIPAEGGAVRVREGVPLAFTLLYPEDELFASIAQFLQQSWQRIGVEVEIQPIDYESLVGDHLETGNYHAALVELSLFRSPDPDPYPFWHQTQIGGGQNYARWDDRSASEYLEQARLTSDLLERARLYRNFQVRFTRELPSLPLFYPVYTYGVDAAVQGISLGPIFDLSDRLSGVPQWFLVEAANPPVQQTP